MPGLVSISIEVELGWGRHSDGLTKHSDNRVAESRYLRNLLETCDRLEIPISFDVVGHLLLDNCTGVHRGPHESSWFDLDPGTDTDTDPLYYAPDLIRNILDCEVDHEICTHTFSHVRCDEVSEEIVDWELSTVRDIHRRVTDRTPTSMVPPTHGSPPASVLLDNGIEVIRMPHPSYEKSGLALHQTHHELDPPIYEDGLVVSHCTPQPSLTAPFMRTGAKKPNLFYQCLPVELRQYIHRRYLVSTLRRTVDEEGYLHHWTHLYNLANDDQWPAVRSFFQRLAKYREAGLIDIATMSDLPARIN